jgi:hypothetical protein
VDANTYAPYAVLAVIALVVAIGYAVLLAALSVMAFRSGQPFIQPLMLVFPIATLVLAYAARRQILNSEGARAGLPLVNVAWWIAVLGGLGYLSYLIAYQLGVRQDSANSFRAWAQHLNEVDLNDPKNPALFYLLDGILEPDQQGRLKVGQADLMFKQRKPQVTALRQTFLVRLANRNRGAMEFAVGGLDNWEQDPSGGQKGNLAVTAKCPEGEFAFNVLMQSKRVDGQWKWQVGMTPSGNLASVRLTRYGQLIRDMEQSGYAMVHEAFIPSVAAQAENPNLFRVFGEPQRTQYPLRAWVEGRMAIAGGGVWPHPEPADYNDRIGKFFDPVEKGDPVREAEQRRAFVSAWRAARLYSTGRFIKSTVDPQPTLFVEPAGFELKVPIEVQPLGSEMTGTAARGAVVLRCDDPAFVARVNDLRAAAASDPLTNLSTDPPVPGSVPWRIIRIESDMKPITAEREAVNAPMPGMPGGH